MPLISLRQLLDHAAENNYGVPAFNINNLEQVRAIMEGAKELNSPVIIQASKGQENMLVQYLLKKWLKLLWKNFQNSNSSSSRPWRISRRL